MGRVWEPFCGAPKTMERVQAGRPGGGGVVGWYKGTDVYGEEALSYLSSFFHHSRIGVLLRLNLLISFSLRSTSARHLRRVSAWKRTVRTTWDAALIELRYHFAFAFAFARNTSMIPASISCKFTIKDDVKVNSKINIKYLLYIYVCICIGESW